MKYSKFFLIVLFLFTSCDILNQDPQTSISEDSAIRDVKSAQAALNGLYSQLQSGDYYGSNLLIIGDVTSDISQSVGTWDFYRSMDVYVTSPGNLENRNLWSQAYTVVNHANNIIAEVPKLPNADQATIDQILGEAYFIRGLAFFDLVRAFGGVPGVVGNQGIPIVTKPSREINESSFPSRASLADSYARVEADLLKAEEKLSGFSSSTRASEAAAKALLSRLYLYLGNFSKAEQYATETINDYSFSLVENFAEIFINENTPESIFELAFNSADQSGIRFWYFPSSGGGRGDIALHDDFVSFVQSRPNDERGKLIAFDENVGVYYPTKYQKAGGVDNIQILRLAEVYLNRAEARAQQDDITGALNDLNRVRNRAGLADTTGAGVDSSKEVLGAIALERSVEFFEEGHRWFDLVRTGEALNVLTDIDRENSGPVSLTEPGRQVFPIPSREIDANPNIEQNEAYK